MYVDIQGLEKIYSYFTQFATHDIWLITGQLGPFSKDGVQNKAGETAELCCRLWPTGPPSMNEVWYAPTDVSSSQYVDALERLFSRTAPIPIISRFYDSSVIFCVCMLCLV